MFREKNFMDEIIGYIKKNLKKGYTKESLKWALINQGYSRIEVEKAIKLAEENLAYNAPILKTKPTIKREIIEPKEFASTFVKSKPSFWQKLFGKS